MSTRDRAAACETHHGCDCREYAVALVERFGGALAVLRYADEQILTIHVGTRDTCAAHIAAGDDTLNTTSPVAVT